MLQLVLGGARSGKSSRAERLALASGKQCVYLATADNSHSDTEMAQRIARHQDDRKADSWTTIEEPLQLAEQLELSSSNDSCILIDCTTLWLTNCLFEAEPRWQERKGDLLAWLSNQDWSERHVIIVGNEVGQGIVPLGEINRRFVDEAGWLHQELAQLADRVVLVTAGIAQVLKGPALDSLEAA